jgi:AraC-like DNA-binding protein
VSTTPDAQDTRPTAGSLPPLVVNTSRVEVLLQERGWTVTRLAQEMGMHRTNVQQTLNGKQGVSPKFQARLWAVFPAHRLDQLFIITGANDVERGDAA